MSASSAELIVEHLVVGPFQTNVYVIGCARTGAGAIVDAGGDSPGLLALLKRHELRLERILQTHAHIDHVGALTQVKRAHPQVPIALHPLERGLYESAVQQGMFFGIPIDPLPAVQEWLEAGQRVRVGELEAQVLHMPGHSPGSVIFYFEQQQTMLSGDVLFQGSIGRTDLPGADPQAMTRSLRALRQYPDQVRVLSGHGPETTLGQEKRANPFLRSL